MLDDERWPNEPDEPGEPEELDPLEEIGPDVPEVEVPQAPDPSENDVSSDLVRDFWKLVAIFNVALLALSLGPMLAFFRGEIVNGSAVFALGAGFFIYGYQRYRRVKTRHRSTDADTDRDDTTTNDQKN